MSLKGTSNRFKGLERALARHPKQTVPEERTRHDAAADGNQLVESKNP